MLIRVVLDNIYSFGKPTELNMFPAPRLSRLNSHKYKACNIELLKLAAFYGANGSGKSNFVKGVKFLKEIVTKGKLPSAFSLKRKKHFHFTGRPTMLAIEFIVNNQAYLYAIEIGDTNVEKEELYLSGLGKKEDSLIFERTTTTDEKTTLVFGKKVSESEEIKILKSILEKNLIKPNEVALKVIAELKHKSFKFVEETYTWFGNKLHVITGETKPLNLVNILEADKEFSDFAQKMIGSFDVGIKGLTATKRPVEKFFGNSNKNDMKTILKQLEENPDLLIGFVSDSGEGIASLNEDNKVTVKQLKTIHHDKEGNPVIFDLSEESDGTRRLIKFLVLLSEIITSDATYIVDELERSIHPLLIKEIVKKFSEDDSTKGQLLFTTHESNLLSQEIFRQDEIWFVEKDKQGCTDLYSLWDFKEHNTKDIQKGYLMGRYGAIPFLSNLSDLDWDVYDFKK